MQSSTTPSQFYRIVYLKPDDNHYLLLCNHIAGFRSELDIKRTIAKYELFLAHRYDDQQALENIIVYELGGFHEDDLAELSGRIGDLTVKVFYNRAIDKIFLSTDAVDYIKFEITIEELVNLLTNWITILRSLNILEE